MAKKKQGFVEKHPFFTLMTLPVSLPVLVAAETLKSGTKKTARRKRTAKRKRSILLPRSVQDMNGYQFEEYVAKQLKKVGYTHVDVTPKSGDYGADILAVTPAKLFSKTKGQKICFQCKKYSKPVGVKAVQEVIGAKVYYNCTVGCVVSTAGFTAAAHNLAKSADIILMDADKIK